MMRVCESCGVETTVIADLDGEDICEACAEEAYGEPAKAVGFRLGGVFVGAQWLPLSVVS